MNGITAGYLRIRRFSLPRRRFVRLWQPWNVVDPLRSGVVWGMSTTNIVLSYSDFELDASLMLHDGYSMGIATGISQ